MGYTIDAAIRAASDEVGYRERGTNDTRYNRWLGTISGYGAGGYGYPWCASFQSWVGDRAGGRADRDYPKTAGCVVAVAWFRSRGRWSSTPHVGDWVFYGPGGGTHVELVVAVNSRTITTIGGNTSGSLNGRYYNGDGVYKKQVTRSSSRIYGYGRPAYNSTEDDMPSEKDVWTWDGIPAPINPATGKTLNPANTTWRPDSYLKNIFEEVRRARGELAATQAAVGELAKTVAQLAADRGQLVDEDALVQRITDQISSIKVRLEAETEDAS